MRPPAHQLLLIGALALVSEAALADMIPLTWDTRGEFSSSVQVKPGRFVELCEKLSAGAEVSWRFKADAALDFNVHFHQGKEVHYPVRQDQVTQSEGVLVAPDAQDYCWMWVHKSKSGPPASLVIQLKRG